MPDFPISARANASGIAVVRFQLNRAGVIWVVSQISVFSTPARQAATCNVTRNGQPMTNTSFLPATASGQPFYRLNPSDVLELTYRNLTNGDTAQAVISYSESLWNQPNDGNVI